MPEIVFVNIEKRYGEVIAVKDLNFTIHDGEYLGLLGPSGCGKTTSLRMISGLTKPTTGKILWNGEPITQLDPQDRDIGYVFQNFAIFPHLTIKENIEFGPKAKNMRPRDIEDNVEQYAKIVGLSEKLDLFANSLDAPDLQRVGLARVLATGAKTLLLDEPLGALDFKIREQFQDELLKLVKDLHLTAIHVTHDQKEAMAICDRIGVMKKGKMIQIGTPNDLLFYPTQIFTAHFIGESDFFEGVITRTSETHNEVQILSNIILKLPIAKPSPSLYDKVVVGIRREFFDLRPMGEDESKRSLQKNMIPGRIISDRYLGEKRRTFVQLKYGRTLEIKRLPHAREYHPGDQVKIYVHPNSVNIFNMPDTSLDEALSVT